MNLKDDVAILKGVGKRRVECLRKLNIYTIEDLVHFFPRRYEDRRTPIPIIEAPIGKDVLVTGRVVSKQISGNPYKRPLLKLMVEDTTACIEILFFNGKFMQNSFQIGDELSLYGKISFNQGRRQMAHPEFHLIGSPNDLRGLIPVYPLTEGLTQNNLRTWQMQAKVAFASIEEWLPTYLVKEHQLCSPAFAMEQVHFPQSERNIYEGRRRFAFEELLILQTGLFYIKNQSLSPTNGIKFSDKISLEPFLNRLPFQLTEGQWAAFQEIDRDLVNNRSMNRLLQGDVGSGKTVVAELTMYKAIKSGYQAVMMAPTELLAKQHETTLKRDFEPLGIRVELLCGSTKSKDRKRILEELSQGKIHILVGTHALIQPDIEFHQLGIVITDEQHRFGVNQRQILSDKGKNPNVLVMSATPIPRTLAVILYGDLDISVIKTLPKGRKQIRTFLRNEDSRTKIYDFLETQVKQGRQAYVVAPLIEESEVINCKSAEELYDELSQRYPHLKFALVHGNMKQQEKDQVMNAFALGMVQVLVSTVVIEVGIDVPNATVMVIENCERFGLAQLHQLRGRVGRGESQSFCILISNSDSKIAKQRNEIMCNTQDGFLIAEEDLKLRGPGEIFGTRQHGIPELNMSDLIKDIEILDEVRDVANSIIFEDPYLEKKENYVLKEKIKSMFGEKIQLKI